MASPSPHWMFPRPHRKLIRVPQTTAAFATVATGAPWTGNRELQIEFENALEGVGLKKAGEHSERYRGRGGSGGRTHASMLYALGLYFLWKESPDAPEEVHLTLAGQALVDQEDALPILRKQVLAHQFPSAYSVGTRIDRRFRVRPFVLLLKLLRDPDLGGYLTDAEIASCVLTYGEGHSAREMEKVKARVLAYRQRGLESLDEDFAECFLGGDDDPATMRKAIETSSGKLGAVANTSAQWLRYTGYAQPADGADYGSEAATVTAINEDLLDEIDEAITEWGRKPLDVMFEGGETPYDRLMAAAAFQRTYGRKVGGVKDQRHIGQLRQMSEHTRLTAQVTASVVHLYPTEMIERVTDELVAEVVNHSGLDPRDVRRCLESLISSPQDGLDQFLDRYQQMAFSSRDEALAFEKATANVLADVFGLEAIQVGQSGRVPDVEVWTDDWLGIIDTKAYSAYGLESDHQLRMQTSYVPRYADGRDGAALKFFMYIAGGFAPSFNANLKKVIRETGVDGSGIGIIAWIKLIVAYRDSGLGHDDLLRIWSLGREITVRDVQDLLEEARSARSGRS